MFSKPLGLILLVLGCVTAAAGGAYVATRQNTAETVATAPAEASAASTEASAASAVAPADASGPAAQPVAETEAKVTAARAEAPEAAKPSARDSRPAAPLTRRRDAPVRQPAVAEAQRTVPMNGGTPAAAPQTEPGPIQASPPLAPEPQRPMDAQPDAPRVPQFEEVILPASSVIGLQLETSLSSDRARLEDRVEARVSRDVMASGRVAIPVGSRVIGSVIEVDRGGKVKAAARLGIRFHTVVLTDGSEVSLRTESIYREGESPSRNSAKKIGGGAVAGMILGGILGGGKGAAVGGATGAAGGTAAVMSGDRGTVHIAPGQFLNARLSSPATITVERRER